MSNDMKIINEGNEGLFSFWYRGVGYGYFETRKECGERCKEMVNGEEFNKCAFTLLTFIKLGNIDTGKIVLVSTIWV